MTAIPVIGRIGRRTRPRGPSARAVLTAAGDSARLPERAVVLSSGLLVVSLLTAWVLAQLYLLGGLEYARHQDRLYADFRAELAEGVAPTGGVIAPGSPVALLRLPGLDVEQVVVEGTSAGHLVGAPGHRRDTVLPGQAGVSVLYGRSQTFGAPFAVMLDEAIGRPLQVVTAQGTSTYRVERVRRADDSVPAPPADGQGRLTLITSEGNGRLGALSPGHVVYVDASLQSEAFEGGGGRVNTISTSERTMASDTSVLPLLALALGALLVVLVALLLAVRRFGRVLTWTVAVPIVGALLWFVGDLAVHLVPNLV